MQTAEITQLRNLVNRLLDIVEQMDSEQTEMARRLKRAEDQIKKLKR